MRTLEVITEELHEHATDMDRLIKEALELCAEYQQLVEAFK